MLACIDFYLLPYRLLLSSHPAVTFAYPDSGAAACQQLHELVDSTARPGLCVMGVSDESYAAAYLDRTVTNHWQQGIPSSFLLLPGPCRSAGGQQYDGLAFEIIRISRSTAALPLAHA